jgi:hypothetical protein
MDLLQRSVLPSHLDLDPYIRGAVPTRVPHLMRQGGTVGLSSKIHKKVGVDSQASFLGVDSDLQHMRSLLDKIRAVELLIPSAEK